MRDTTVKPQVSPLDLHCGESGDSELVKWIDTKGVRVQDEMGLGLFPDFLSSSHKLSCGFAVNVHGTIHQHLG